jgi:hypothetical protein
MSTNPLPADRSTKDDANQAHYQFLDRQHPNNYRSQEVNALIQAIHARENRLVLGLPGMGVSNLLRFLVTREDLAGREVTFVYLNCDTIKIGFDFTPFFDSLVDEWSEQGSMGTFSGEMAGFKRLKELVTRIGGKPSRRVAIVIDQGDRLVLVGDQDFYRKLKSLTDLNKRICYIFAASASLADLIDQENLLFAGRRLAVGPLNEPDCLVAVTEEAGRLGQTFDDFTKTRLVRLTGGHPGLLRAVSSAVVQEALDPVESVDKWTSRLLARADIQYRCQKMWQVLSLQQKATLHSLTQDQTEATTSLAWLYQYGLVLQRQELYQLFSPIFEGFVATQGDLLMPESIAITGGKVFRGDAEISLRPLEQKLLACLMAEPGRVYTHDEIAWSVWNTAEVTPDMITGLVSQLRSQLGKTCIKTHYGRGYEYISRG